jgi:hypothetical protein
MKIADIETGAEYAYKVSWGSYSRKRLRALEVATIVENEGRFSERKVRKVRCQVLDWDTGEDVQNGATLDGYQRAVIDVAARQLEPFQDVKDRLDAEAARDRQIKATKEMVVKAFDRLGVPADVYEGSGPWPVTVKLTQDAAEALARAALISD